MANRVVGQNVYDWSVVSLDGRVTKSSSGLELSPTGALDKMGHADIVFVCGGVIAILDTMIPTFIGRVVGMVSTQAPDALLRDDGAALLGMALEKRAPWKEIVWLPVQRFGYRQMMYYVVVKAVLTAIQGPRVGWGKLERRNTAAVEGAA